jgi:hypothetical protein
MLPFSYQVKRIKIGGVISVLVLSAVQESQVRFRSENFHSGDEGYPVIHNPSHCLLIHITDQYWHRTEHLIGPEILKPART